jgi:hypothetical protein
VPHLQQQAGSPMSAQQLSQCTRCSTAAVSMMSSDAAIVTSFGMCTLVKR